MLYLALPSAIILCVRGGTTTSYARHHNQSPRRNHCLGSLDRILCVHRQNLAALVACGREAESASMAKWNRDDRLWSEHGLLSVNRRAGGVHALITGGFPYCSPPLMLAFRIGFLTALCGVVAALIGKRQLEAPTIVSSLLCLLIRFVEAMAQ
jgi:hypothetical protein